MSSFRSRGNSKYELCVELGYLPSGQRDRRYRRITAKNDREAKKQLALFEAELSIDAQPVDNHIKFEAYIKRWKEEFGLTDLDPNTYDTYCGVIDHSILPYFKAAHLGKIKTYDLKRYLNQEQRNGVGQYALEKRHRVMRSLFGVAKNWELIKLDPSIAVKKPSIKRREKEVYNEQEIVKLMKAVETIPKRHQLMIKLALIGGLRRGEILGIDMDKDIDYKKKCVHIRHSLQYTKSKGLRLKEPKADSKRTVTLPADLIAEIELYKKERWKDRSDIGDRFVGFKDEEENDFFLLFGHENGVPYLPTAVTHMWVDFIGKTDLKKISFHDLRHSSATYLLSKGINMKVIQKRLGHKDIKTTMNLYAHVLEKDAEEPAEIFSNMNKKEKKTQ